MRRGTIRIVIGGLVRVHDLDANDLGVAHVPTPISVGDLVLLEHRELRIVDVVPTRHGSPLAALVVMCRSAHVRVLPV